MTRAEPPGLLITSISWSPVPPAARKFGKMGLGRLNRGRDPSVWRTSPPEAITRAAPAATSHSCLGTKVHVPSARPAATCANLLATDPQGFT